jgi:hypothetical protein
MTWHKAWAQPSQGVADRRHHLASRPCVGACPETVLSTCLEEVVLKVSNAQRWCKEETWSPCQFAWLASLTSGPHMPNLRPEHRLNPPINTLVLPSSKKCEESEV